MEYLPTQVKRKYFDDYINKNHKENYKIFFESLIKKLNFDADKTIKKLSKLYDMTTDTKSNISMSKINNRSINNIEAYRKHNEVKCEIKNDIIISYKNK